MRLIATSDLHYNIARSRGPTQELARRINAAAAAGGRGPAAADALLLVGDSAGADKAHLEECLGLFDEFAGRKFFVAGNHCLWSNDGTDAIKLLREDLPAIGRRHGFTCLEYEPAMLGPVGLVGTVGWYDYSLRHEELAVPIRFYRRKIAPGAARYFREHRDLLDRQDDLKPVHHELTARWMDGVHARLPISDEAFTRMLADKLAGQLDELAPRVDRIVVAIHHIPFANLMPELLHEGSSPGWQFVAAYMGSELFGQVCLAQPKVTHVLCGHTHQPMRVRNGPIECICVGSNYTLKRMVELDL